MTKEEAEAMGIMQAVVNHTFKELMAIEKYEEATNVMESWTTILSMIKVSDKEEKDDKTD